MNKVELQHLTAYRCLGCGHFTISGHDGVMCAKCGGPVTPAGEATYKDAGKNLTVSVSIKDTDIFKCILKGLSELINDKNTPGWIKEKIGRFIRDGQES